MSIYYSQNPTDWTALDGIYIYSSYAPPSLKSQGTGTVAIASVLDWGDNKSPKNIVSGLDIRNNFGAFSGLERSLSGLKFSQLFVQRVSSASDKAATGLLVTGVNVVAAYAGSAGNNITVGLGIESASSISLNVTFKQFSPSDLAKVNPVTVTETYSGITVSNWASTVAMINSQSKLIDIVGTLAAIPASASSLALTGGVTGSPSASEFIATLNSLNNNSMIGQVNIFTTDSLAYSAQLSSFIADKTSQIAVVGDSAPLATSVSTNAALYRNNDGRVIYCPTQVMKLDGYGEITSHASNLIMASILSSIGADRDPAYVGYSSFFNGVVALGSNAAFSRSDFISGISAGLCLVEFDRDFGFKFKSPVTCGGDASKGLDSIVTRRMRDFLEVSISKFMKMYQNDDNTAAKRKDVKRAIVSFIKSLQEIGMLPEDDATNPVYLVDTDTMNTPAVIANDEFISVIKVRLKSSMRFIVINSQVSKQPLA